MNEDESAKLKQVEIALLKAFDECCRRIGVKYL